jgi:hypothetical protein
MRMLWDVPFSTPPPAHPFHIHNFKEPGTAPAFAPTLRRDREQWRETTRSECHPSRGTGLYAFPGTPVKRFYRAILRFAAEFSKRRKTPYQYRNCGYLLQFRTALSRHACAALKIVSFQPG